MNYNFLCKYKWRQLIYIIYFFFFFFFFFWGGGQKIRIFSFFLQAMVVSKHDLNSIFIYIYFFFGGGGGRQKHTFRGQMPKAPFLSRSHFLSYTSFTSVAPEVVGVLFFLLISVCLSVSLFVVSHYLYIISIYLSYCNLSFSLSLFMQIRALFLSLYSLSLSLISSHTHSLIAIFLSLSLWLFFSLYFISS